jgi:hypothetical protein
VNRAALRAAIEQYRREAAPLDKHAAIVLDRLVKDRTDLVLSAFRVVPPARWSILIGDCIAAEREARTYRETVERLRRKLVEIEKHEHETEAAHALLAPEGLAIPEAADAVLAAGNRLVIPGDRLSERLHQHYSEAASRRRLFEIVLHEHGRKSDPAAARSAGIGILKESLLRLVGKGCQAEVASLATRVLNYPAGISVDAVRRALTPSERLQRAIHNPRITWTVFVRKA